MRHLLVGLLVSTTVAGLGLTACKPGMLASYSDRDRVTLAQKKWCAMLSKAESPDAEWPYTKACEAAYPSSSAAFLVRLTSCFEKQYADFGENTADEATMMAECTNQVRATSDPGDAKLTELVQARCRRTARCSPITEAKCIEAYEDLDPADRLVLTSMYNLRAQAEIAGCLDDGDCTEDEDAANYACYEPLEQRRAWFTTMLGKTTDMSLSPSN